MEEKRLKVRRIIECDGYAEPSRQSGVCYRSLKGFIEGKRTTSTTRAKIDLWLAGVQLPKRISEAEIYRWARKIGTGRLERRTGIDARAIHQWLYYRKEMPDGMREEYFKGPHKVGRKTVRGGGLR